MVALGVGYPQISLAGARVNGLAKYLRKITGLEAQTPLTKAQEFLVRKSHYA